MEVAIDEALKQNKFVEGTICYTGDVSDLSRDKYTLKYYGIWRSSCRIWAVTLWPSRICPAC